MPPDTGKSASPLDTQSLRRRRSLQFSLRSVLVFMLVFSVVCEVLFTFPDAFASAAIGVLSILLLATLIASVVYAQGYARAFCIGALVPTFLVSVAVACVFVVMIFETPSSYGRGTFQMLKDLAAGLRIAAYAGWLMALAAGALSAVVRWYFVR